MDKKIRLKSILPMTGNSTSKDKVEAADNIINKKIFNLSNFRDIFVDVDNDWKTESDSRSLRRWLHTHIFLSDFTRAYAITNDEKYFTESFELLNKWFETYPIENRDNIDPLAYHDEGTAIRLLFWFKYYNQFIDLMNDEQKKLLDEKIDETGDLLFQDDFYAGLNNHGMFQDMGLVAYSLFKFEDYRNNNMFNKALDRIVTYFKQVFTEEGIHKEHAPSYHILLIYSLKQILQTLDIVEYYDNRTVFLDNVFRKGEEYIINITMPNYKLPNISDSDAINMSTIGRYRDLFDSEEYKFITSAGEKGKAPNTLIKSYPITGYLVAREKWAKNSTYFLFLASYHMHYHKHTDDLSFILYKNGPIFIDAGPYSHNYNDPITQYAYSQFAHSTLIINNRSLPRTDYKFDDVFISRNEIDNDNQKFVVEGVNNRFEGSSHKRIIEGDLKSNEFIISDSVTSASFNQYKILFQVNGTLDIVSNGEIISIFKNNAKIAEVEILSTIGIMNLDNYIITAQQFPNVMGYQFPKLEKMIPSKTIVIEAYNSKKISEIKTVIRLNDFKIKGAANFNRKNEIVRHRDISYIYEDVGNRKLAVVFSGTNRQHNYNLDEYNELKNKGFNILYLLDNQSIAGQFFIQAESTSSIESDVMFVINKIMNRFNFTNRDTYLFGRSKGGFAALYYSLSAGFHNVFVSSPLILLGDYYERQQGLDSIVKTLCLQNKETARYYLNDYINNLNDFTSILNLNICIGENDYHKEKHVGYLMKWLEEKNIAYSLNIYPDADFSEDKEQFINFLMNYNFD